MTRKTGRNHPCPCGSGKKYKRCCLPKEEAAALENAREALSADEAFDPEFDENEPDFDEDDEEFYDVDHDAPLLDMSAIRRVVYTRGLVEKLSDLRRGRGVRVTEWEAPRIPVAVLDSIEREGLDVLPGEWGDPKAGEPIQVDTIDIETDDDVLTIAILNRAICLFRTDAEEIRRIHRVCEALETAASTGSEPSADAHVQASDSAATRDKEASQTAEARADLRDVLGQHRRQQGTCALCGDVVSRTGVQGHLLQCAPAHDARTGTEQRLVHLRATAPSLPAYWLDIEAKTDARLEALDSLLRSVWLECCGHLSSFRIGEVEYFSRGYDFGLRSPFGSFGGNRTVQRSMSARLRDALPFVGDRFQYEYDFGSTTLLQFRVMGERTGRLGSSPVRLLARNAQPFWPCAICGERATLICASCCGSERNPFVCAEHRRRHACGEESFRPVVNSPRMGMCGYAG